MKKLSMLVFSVLLLFVGIVAVNAKTEDDLYNALSQTITFSDGSTWGLSDGDLKKAKDYLKKYEVSSDDVDYIISQINTAKSIIKKEGSGEFGKYSSKNKSDLLKLVENVSNKTKVKAEVTDGSIVVYNVDSDGNKTTPFYEVTKLVKQTGSTDTMAIIASISLVIVLIGTILVSKEIKANN